MGGARTSVYFPHFLCSPNTAKSSGRGEILERGTLDTLQTLVYVLWKLGGSETWGLGLTSAKENTLTTFCFTFHVRFHVIFCL